MFVIFTFIYFQSQIWTNTSQSFRYVYCVCVCRILPTKRLKLHWSMITVIDCQPRWVPNTIKLRFWHIWATQMASNSVDEFGLRFANLIYSYTMIFFSFNFLKNCAQFLCNEDTTNITLHSKNLDINVTDIELNSIEDDDRPKKLSLGTVEFDGTHDFLIIHVKEKLTKDHRYMLSIPFQAELTQGLLGYYRSSYIDRKTQTKQWVWIFTFNFFFSE